MPATKRLLTVWLILLALTLATGLSAETLSQASATLLVPVLALASLLKARLILSHYLGLCRAPQWNQAFFAILIALAAIVYGFELVAFLK